MLLQRPTPKRLLNLLLRSIRLHPQQRIVPLGIPRRPSSSPTTAKPTKPTLLLLLPPLVLLILLLVCVLALLLAPCTPVCVFVLRLLPLLLASKALLVPAKEVLEALEACFLLSSLLLAECGLVGAGLKGTHL